jgi:hypothetical protein
MCRKMLDAGIMGIHMYTLNLERSAVAILEALGLINKQKVRFSFILHPFGMHFISCCTHSECTQSECTSVHAVCVK